MQKEMQECLEYVEALKNRSDVKWTVDEDMLASWKTMLADAAEARRRVLLSDDTAADDVRQLGRPGVTVLSQHELVRPPALFVVGGCGCGCGCGCSCGCVAVWLWLWLCFVRARGDADTDVYMVLCTHTGAERPGVVAPHARSAAGAGKARRQRASARQPQHAAATVVSIQSRPQGTVTPHTLHAVAKLVGAYCLVVFVCGVCLVCAEMAGH